MSYLESHVYPWGSAYRQGGDEYVCLIPNADAKNASQRLYQLQVRLRNADYPGTIEKGALAVSIGVYEVTPDCCLTEHEILDAAASAKKKAKASDGKGRIAISDSSSPGDEGRVEAKLFEPDA